MLKHFDGELSDEQCKEIHDSVDLSELAQNIIQQGPPYTRRQAEVLAKVAGNMDDDHDFERDGHMWRDDILEKYADHIQNYKYQYNEEALKLDPSTDLETEHIGPMAQDIEQVNPAAVINDPETGYKKVDTGRLALMNAGAIASLARELREIRNGG
jgi:hypothetical protein